LIGSARAGADCRRPPVRRSPRVGRAPAIDAALDGTAEGRVEVLAV
jgi:hypothetical protein